MIDFSDFLEEEESPILDPREIFMSLSRDKRFAFPRDIQTEVMKRWFSDRNQRDVIIKLNVGSGKTLIGLMLLQSSINERKGPAVYICPDNHLVSQVRKEGELLGLHTTDDPRDPSFQSAETICVINVHKLFNGRSVFGVGASGVKIRIGSLVVDDAHACIASISDQFRISLPSSHPAYAQILGLVEVDLKEQSAPRFLDLKGGDPLASMEVPFWAWQNHSIPILETLHESKDSEPLKFSYPLICEVLEQCRCVVTGNSIEIEPICPPTEQIRAFARAERRIYMTATLADDSVLVTHFGANATHLTDPIVPTSAQSMGERMILMPQEINPDIEFDEVRKLLVKLSKTENVVVIVPSSKSSEVWREVADQILLADNVSAGISRLRRQHVGLTVLVNRYDGIDLPDDACRILAIFDLPEVSSLVASRDAAVLADSTSMLRHQIQRIEQGMGRGVRSNDDYCVVVLFGAKLVQRLKSPDAEDLLTAATRAQLDITSKLTKQLEGGNTDDIEEVINQCLERDTGWVAVSKNALRRSLADDRLRIDPATVAVRTAFDLWQEGDPVEAAAVLNRQVNDTADRDLRAWLKVRLAEITHCTEPGEAQRILLSAHKANAGVVRPINGVAYQKLKPLDGHQAAEATAYNRERFLDATSRLLYIKALLEDLKFDPTQTDRFESALDAIARLIGIVGQRPDKQFKVGPDNLWVFPGPEFFVIECKSGATSSAGVAKTDLGQLEQSMSWFKDRYSETTSMTPIMVHPLCHSGPGATPVEGMRILPPDRVMKLGESLTAFCRSLGDANVLNDVNRVGALLKEHSLTPGAFLSAYTIRMKQSVRGLAS